MTSLFLKKIAITITAFLCLVSCQNKTIEAEPYNVLFIAVDDLRTELNCYGAEHIISPNIDRLAASGVRFSRAYVQQAICMASRASIMSGVRPERFGIYTGEALTDMMPDVLTLNKFFRQNGYTVSSCGKIYHHGEDTKQQFGSEYLVPKETWFGSGYVTEESRRLQQENTKTNRGPAYEWADVPDEAYKDGANTLLAIKELKKLKEADKPFFLAYGLTKPHLPFVAPQKYWDLYPEETIELTHLTEHPEGSNKYTVRTGGELGNYALMPKKFADVDDNTAKTLRRGYYACVSYIDAQIGKVLDELETLGLRENTIIVLWGDHGYKLGDYKSWCKWSNMTMDTNIPMLVSIPNGKKGVVCEQMVEALDLYPTLAELCGLQQPQHLEGKSLVPVLNNPTFVSESTKYAYTIWPDQRFTYDNTVMGYSVKDQRFNYVEWVKLKTGKLVARELYDHSNDPEETKNVAEMPQYKDEVARLAQQCQLRKANTQHDHDFKKLR